jgi:UPF0716 protein FxsA
MRMLLILLILLAFPVLEVFVLFELASRYGWWVLGYLLLSAAFGAMLIMEERIVVFARLIQALQEGSHPMLALVASGRKMIAGLLLILPGVIGDAIALLLLLIPLPTPKPRPQPTEPDVIEGQWRRED